MLFTCYLWFELCFWSMVWKANIGSIKLLKYSNAQLICISFLIFAVATEALENSVQAMLVNHLLCIQEIGMPRLLTLLMGIQQGVDLNSTIS